MPVVRHRGAGEDRDRLGAEQRVKRLGQAERGDAARDIDMRGHRVERGVTGDCRRGARRDVVRSEPAGDRHELRRIARNPPHMPDDEIGDGLRRVRIDQEDTHRV